MAKIRMQVTPVWDIDEQQLTGTPVTWYLPIEIPDDQIQYALKRPCLYVTSPMRIQITDTMRTEVGLSFQAQIYREKDDIVPDVPVPAVEFGQPMIGFPEQNRL